VQQHLLIAVENCWKFYYC